MRRRLDSHAAAVVAALLSWPVFLLFRTHVLNPDGNGFTPKFEADVPRVGAHVTHDEMLELFVHSRFWFHTHGWWGWSVVQSYQVLSCAAGACFVYVLFRLARRLAPEAPLLIVAGVLAGGYMQLFFGDVENYTMTAVFIALYVLAALRYVVGESPLWVPAVALATAASFHLESAWLGPSLLYLCALSRQRSGDDRAAIRSLAAATFVVLATVVYMEFHGLPLRRFFSSHAGEAIRMKGMFSFTMPASYFLEQLRLLLLLCPVVVIAVPLVGWRAPHDQTDAFLAIAAASTMVFQFTWKSQIGVFNDWNLYAVNGLMLAFWLWRRLAIAARAPWLRAAAFALAALCAWPTYAWILANHAGG